MRRQKRRLPNSARARGIVGICVFVALFLLYCDFWSWGRVGVLMGGWLPLWFVWHMLLIAGFSVAALLFTRSRE